MTSSIEIHLIYASIVWLAAWLLTSLHRGSATIKYWIWVATSLNFMAPLGAVLDKSLAAHLSWATPLGVIGDAGLRIAENAILVGAVWFVGAALMVMRLCSRIRAERREAQAMAGQSDPSTSFLAHGVPIRFAEGRQAPAQSEDSGGHENETCEDWPRRMACAHGGYDTQKHQREHVHQRQQSSRP